MELHLSKSHMNEMALLALEEMDYVQSHLSKQPQVSAGQGGRKIVALWYQTVN